jgi:hypothetical protein
MWVASGRITNPTLNQVLADTGQMVAKQRIWQAVVSATVAAPFELQHLAADGTTVLKSQIIACQALDTKTIPRQVEEVTMATNERIRIIAVTAITGSVSVSIDITA